MRPKRRRPMDKITFGRNGNISVAYNVTPKETSVTPSPNTVKPSIKCWGILNQSMLNKGNKLFFKKVSIMPHNYSINPPLRSLRLRIKLGLYTPFLFQKVASTLLAWLNVSLAVVFPSSVA